MTDLARYIRDVANFPIPGIVFKDITTLLQEPGAYKAAIEGLTNRVRAVRPDVVVGIESRGFIFAAPVAFNLGVGFVPVRKLGKLPARTVSVEYELEYGVNTVEMHVDAIRTGQRVVIMDDLLATGGTAAGSVQLVEQLGGRVAALAFLVELTFLEGRARLPGREIITLVQY
jgi:adenine phosphoribosyltransferase